MPALLSKPTTPLGELKQQLRQLALRAPASFQPPGLPERPCAVVSICGMWGVGKSTCINVLFAALLGISVVVARTAEADEDAGGTKATTAYALHAALWPGNATPPAYVYLIDNVGFHEVIDTARMAAMCFRSIITGTARIGGEGAFVPANEAAGELRLPRPLGVLFAGSVSQLCDQPTLRLLVELGRTHTDGGVVPLVVAALMTKVDKVPVDGVAEADYSGRLRSREVRAVVQQAARRAGLTEDHVFPQMALDTVDADAVASGLDLEQNELRLSLALRALVTVVGEGLTRHSINSDAAVRASVGAGDAAVDAGERQMVLSAAETPAVLQAMVRSAGEARNIIAHAGDEVSKSLDAACEIVVREGLSGPVLLRMSAAEIRGVFGACRLGVVNTIVDMVDDQR